MFSGARIGPKLKPLPMLLGPRHSNGKVGLNIGRRGPRIYWEKM